MEDVFVYVVPIPGPIREAVTPCDGGYTVYIDESLTDEARERAYRHALRHIVRGDFGRPVQEAEAEAHEDH